MKRCCLSKLPTWIKSKSPATGITISKVLFFSTILMPVVLIGSDMISDGGVLAQMWPYTLFGKLIAGEYSLNKTATNSTGTTANSSSTELAASQEGNGTVVGSNSTQVEQGGQSVLLGRQIPVLDWTLGFLFLVSIFILFFSTVNLLLFRSNWSSTLLRNARTTLMMESRELERKDVPVPLGNNLIFSKLYKVFFTTRSSFSP